MTDIPEWAVAEARIIVSNRIAFDGSMVRKVLSGALDKHEPDIDAIARALAATAARVERETLERCANVVDRRKRDASYDDSAIGAGEHNNNEVNIAREIRALPLKYAKDQS